MDTETTTAEQAKTKKYKIAGGLLIALAFVVPLVVAALGIGSAYLAGRAFGNVAVSYVVLALLAWPFVGKRSALAKAKGRVMVAALLCLVSVANTFPSVHDDHVAKKYVPEALVLQARQSQRVAALSKRFEELNMTTYFEPQALVDKDKVAAAKASVEQFKTLLAQRSTLLQTHAAELQQFMNAMPPSDFREGVQQGIAKAQAETQGVYAALDKSQSTHAAAMLDFFDWVARNQGNLRVANGQLEVQPSQRGEFAELVEKLKSSAAAAAREEERAAAFNRTAETRVAEFHAIAKRVLER